MSKPNRKRPARLPIGGNVVPFPTRLSDERLLAAVADWIEINVRPLVVRVDDHHE
jgi:hypothetical protein